MKFCNKCDLYIDRNVNYCGECGTKLTDIDMSPTTAISPDFKPNNFTNTKGDLIDPDFYNNEFYFGHVKKKIQIKSRETLNPPMSWKNMEYVIIAIKREILKISLNVVHVEIFFVIIVGKITAGAMENHHQLELNIMEMVHFLVLMDLNS
jgi:hypothetical protein